MTIVIQVLLAWIYGHLLEYGIHKHILHNNKKFNRIFKRHFGTHHRISRKNDMYDENYINPFSIGARFELIGLSFLLIIHLPFIFFYPYFFAMLVVSASIYYIAHRTAHISVEWGKKWLPWHAAHHMGKNQHLNWGVRLPIIDLLLGTYKLKRRVVENE